MIQKLTNSRVTEYYEGLTDFLKKIAVLIINQEYDEQTTDDFETCLRQCLYLLLNIVQKYFGQFSCICFVTVNYDIRRTLLATISLSCERAFAPTLVGI